MRDSQEQLKLMTQQMDRLAVEKAELRARNKILKHVVRMNADCVDRLQVHKVDFNSSPKLVDFAKICKQTGFFQPLALFTPEASPLRPKRLRPMHGAQ